MESPGSEIPVVPIAFRHPLKNFAQALVRGKARIVAIGSSSTAGEGGIVPYPNRLPSWINQTYSNPAITVVNQGIGGTEAPGQLQRFDADVFAAYPDLVIWQVGTNAVWQSMDMRPPPPSIDATTEAIRAGLERLKDYGKADVILMDLQYVPALLTPAKDKAAKAMVEKIRALADGAGFGVNVFRRFALMQGLHDIERISFDRLVDPADESRLHGSEWATDRLARSLADAILDGVKLAWPPSAATGA